jgi:hypothetical protein
MADQWEEAAKQFKPQPGIAAPASASQATTDEWEQAGKEFGGGSAGPPFAGNPKSPSEVSNFLKQRYPQAYQSQPSVTRQALTGAGKSILRTMVDPFGISGGPEQRTGVPALTQPKGEGEEAGSIFATGAQSALPLAAGVTAALSKFGQMAGRIPGLQRLTPTNLYGGSLRPSPSMSPAGRSEIIQTGLRERIPVSEAGLSRLQGANEGINDKVKALIDAKSGQPGMDINPLDVTKPVNRLRSAFSTQVNPESDVNAINASKRGFLNKHTAEAPFTKIEPMVEEGPGYYPSGQGVTRTKVPLTLNEAQAEKQGTYRVLSKKYGELGSADTEAQKALARGLKNEIQARVPEVAPLNAREGRLIDLEEPLARSINREGNRQLLGFRMPFDTPTIKSNVAIGMNRLQGAMGKPLFQGTSELPSSLMGPAERFRNLPIVGTTPGDANAGPGQPIRHVALEDIATPSQSPAETMGSKMKARDVANYREMLRSGSEPPPLSGRFNPDTGKIELSEGHRRLEALKAEGRKTAPVIIGGLGQ